MGAERDRLMFLDGARALSAGLVVLVHVRATEQAMPLPAPLDRFFDLGHYAVTVFIVISGFSLGLGWAKFAGTSGWIWQFLQRRAWRIVPTYLAAVAVSVLLIVTLLGRRTGTHWDVVLPLDWSGVAVHALLLQDFLPGRAPNHVFWSIAIEWHIYFLFPFILALALGRRPRIAIALLVLAVYAVWATGWLQETSFTVQYIACFGLGVLAARITDRLVATTIAGLALACVGSGALVLLPGHLPSTNALVDLPLAVAAAGCFSLMRGGQLKALARALAAKPLPQLGMIAYSVYLIHAPVLQLVWQYGLHPLRLSQPAEFGLLLTTGSIVAVGSSWLFFLVAERPFLGRPGWLKSRKSSAV